MRRAALLAACAALLAAAPAAAQRAGGGASPTALAEARRFLCPHGGAPVRLAGRNGGGLCLALRGARGRAGGAAGGGWDATGWDAGLGAVRRVQAACPAGTLPAPVRDWRDAVRCVPA